MSTISPPAKKIYLFDTTLRDGAQAESVAFTLEDKVQIFHLLDDFGVDYVECGWPSSNPKDMEFFSRLKTTKRKKAKVTAFGSTRHPKNEAKQDANLIQLVKTQADVVCIFGKTWDFQVTQALNISLEENLDLIFDSIVFLKKHFSEVVFDLEHFFDGYKANFSYSEKILKVATQAGADFLVFCDTNGGTLPWEVEGIITSLQPKLEKPFGIHAHNDCELAVSNSLSALKLGATMVQGTINGFGERCGNANLVSILANAQIKMGFSLVSKEQMQKLTFLSHSVAEIANLGDVSHQPFTGKSAFAHKGGIHVSAVNKNPSTYEHINPVEVGNSRRVLISELSGNSNFVTKFHELGLDSFLKHPHFPKTLSKLKELEFQGYAFEGADASFKLFVLEECDCRTDFFQLISYRIMDEKRNLQENPFSEATVKIKIPQKEEQLFVAEGMGPVDALSNALKKGLSQSYPELQKLVLVDYKVRILDSQSGTAAKTRVLITNHYQNQRWTTVGLSFDIISASLKSLLDGFQFLLLELNSQKENERMQSVV